MRFKPFRLLLPAAVAAIILPGCIRAVAGQSDSDNIPELEAETESVTEIPTGQATLIFVGDAMQHTAQLDRARELGNDSIQYDYSGCFDLIAPMISEADYAVCNLEVPLGGGPRYSGYPCFSAPDSFAESLRDAGFDLFLTANNHCLDSGDRAAKRTLLALDSLGVAHTGTFRNRAERDSLAPLPVEINGIRFAFLNYTYGTNGILPKEDTEVALIERDRMADEIAKARAKGAEIVVVCIHWGVEYVLLENAVQRETADFLVKAGADLIIGGHPHVIQPMKVVRDEARNKDVLIVYSLGNFISNMKTGDTRGGALVKVTVERDSLGTAKFRDAAYDTFFAAKPEGNRNFRVYPSSLADSIPAAQRHHWKIFDTTARRIFDTHNIGVNPIGR